MITEAYGKQTIPVPVKGIRKVKTSYKLHDIAQLVFEAFRSDHHELREFAKAIPHTYEGLRSLFDFVYTHIDYQGDPEEIQAVQSPAVLFHRTRSGDCKSMTNFITCTVFQMGLPVTLKLVDYGDPREKHIYPIATLPGGQKVVMDVVFAKQQGATFNQEKMNYTTIKELNLNPGLYKIGAVRDTMVSIEQLEEVLADVPDTVISQEGGDVTEMTRGELTRFLAKRRFQTFAEQESNPQLKAAYSAGVRALNDRSTANIGTVATTTFGKRLQSFLDKTGKQNQPAFKPFTLRVPNTQKVSGLGKFFKKIGKAFKKLWKKFMNWIFKGAGEKMGPYFLFLFLKKKQTSEIRRRYDKQTKVFKWLAKNGKFSEKDLMALAANGIKKQTGKSPQLLLNSAAGGAKITGIGSIAAFASIAFKALGVVITAIKKVIGLFKKKGTPKADKDSVSDLVLIEEANRKKSPPPPSKPKTSKPSAGTRSQNHPESSGGGAGAGGLAIAASLLLMLMAA